MRLYKSRQGEIGSQAYWKAWAQNFYASLSYDDYGRDVHIVKRIDVLMPDDWWKRTQRVLKLEQISGSYDD